LVGKQEGKGPLGRPRRRWVDTIRIDLLVERGLSFLMGNPEGKRPLGRPRLRWVVLY